MSNIIPRVQIKLEPDSSEFVLEELTFNPFISSTFLWRKENVVDLWMELQIRRIDKDAADVKMVPNINLTFNEEFKGIDDPTCRLPFLPNSRPGINDDMNFVMHSDIWYSFVRANGEDREFMSKGYNQPIRILYPCLPCEDKPGEHINSEHWFMGRNHILSHQRYEHQAKDLFTRIRKFNEELAHTEAQSTVWESTKIKFGKDETDVDRLLDQDSYAPAYFKRNDSHPKGRFAVKRLPWKIPEDQIDEYMGGISYGATAVIEKHNLQYKLKPVLFSIARPELVDCKISSGEAIRFWVRWQSRNALHLDAGRDRFSFTYDLSIGSNIERFNTFFRAPEGFDPVPGSVTPLSAYPVPPRLFFIWQQDKVKPDQCFSYHETFERERNVEISLSAEFSDKNEERNTLIHIFFLSIFIGVSCDLALESLYHDFDHNSVSGKLHLDISPYITSCFLGIAAYQKYRHRYFSKVGLAVLLASSFFLVEAWHVGKTTIWLALIVALFYIFILGLVFITFDWWDFIKEKANRMLLSTTFFSRLRARRRSRSAS